jgi:Na+-driven multidrug efflux pump
MRSELDVGQGIDYTLLNPAGSNPETSVQATDDVRSNTMTNLTTIEALKTIARTGGVMLLARFMISAAGFVTGYMMTESASSTQEQQDILAAGALIGSIQRLTLAIPTVWVSVYGNRIGGLYGDSKSENREAELPIETKEEIGRIFKQSLLMSFIVTVPSFLIQSFSYGILKVLNQNEMHSNLAQEYFNSFRLGLFPSLLFANQQSFLMSTNRPYSAFFQNLLYLIILLPLSYKFIQQDHLGYNGFGWASTTAITGSFFTFFVWQLLAPQFRSYNFHKISSDVLPSSEEREDFISNGGKYSAQLGVELITDWVIVTLIGAWSSGNVDLDASNIAFQYFFLLLIPLGNAANAVGYAVSQHANNLANVQKIRRVTLGFSFIIPAVVLAFSAFFPREFVSLFLDKDSENKETIINLGKQLLWMITSTLCLYLPRFAEAAYIRGLTGKTDKALLSSVVSNSISLVGGTLLSKFTLFGTAKSFFVAKLAGEAVATPWLVHQANKV